MKEYEKPQRSFTPPEAGQGVNLILCVLYTMTYMILQGLKENLREMDIF